VYRTVVTLGNRSLSPRPELGRWPRWRWYGRPTLATVGIFVTRVILEVVPETAGFLRMRVQLEQKDSHYVAQEH